QGRAAQRRRRGRRKSLRAQPDWRPGEARKEPRAGTVTKDPFPLRRRQSRSRDTFAASGASPAMQTTPKPQGRRAAPCGTARLVGWRYCLIPLSDFLLNLLLLGGFQLHRPDLDGQLVELAGEFERHLVILIVHRRAGVAAHVERLVPLPD